MTPLRLAQDTELRSQQQYETELQHIEQCEYDEELVAGMPEGASDPLSVDQPRFPLPPAAPSLAASSAQTGSALAPLLALLHSHQTRQATLQRQRDHEMSKLIPATFSGDRGRLGPMRSRMRACWRATNKRTPRNDFAKSFSPSLDQGRRPRN